MRAEGVRASRVEGARLVAHGADFLADRAEQQVVDHVAAAHKVLDVGVRLRPRACTHTRTRVGRKVQAH
eukprot:3454725-Prymnesium_polylepis.1